MKLQHHPNPGEKTSPNGLPRLGKPEVSRLLKLAAQAEPDQMPLKGQAEAALLLRSRGFGVNQISRWLGANGLPVAPSTVCKFLKKQAPANAGTDGNGTKKIETATGTITNKKTNYEKHA